MKKKILISSGYKDFYLISAAKSLLKNKSNLILHAGFFINPFIKRIFLFNKFKKLDYKRQNIDFKYLRTFLLGEIIHEFALFLNSSFKLKTISDLLIQFSYKIYSIRIIKVIKKINNFNIYHFRSGFGGRSVEYAKSIGLKVICDHSIAHPSLVEYLTINKGKFPKKKPQKPKNFWKIVLEDLNNADTILVNSQFVKKTLIFMNIPKEKIKVIYIGLEDKYFKNLKKKKFKKTNKRKIKFLFAGGINQRKGIDELKIATKKLSNKNINFELSLVGGLTKEFKNKYHDLFLNQKVKYKGILNYKQLLNEMYKSDVFVFPSRAEGSARVIFEAMAAGCAIITTPNTGSIVKNNVNGFLINSGNSNQLYNSMKKFISKPSLVNNFGKVNQKLIRVKYNPKIYGEKLIQLYNSI